MSDPAWLPMVRLSEGWCPVSTHQRLTSKSFCTNCLVKWRVERLGTVSAIRVEASQQAPGPDFDRAEYSILILSGEAQFSRISDDDYLGLTVERVRGSLARFIRDRC